MVANITLLIVCLTLDWILHITFLCIFLKYYKIDTSKLKELDILPKCPPLTCGAEKAMASHSSTLAWKIPWTEEPGWLQSMGSPAKSQTRLSDFTFTFSLSCIGERNGNLLQCSCLENPRDGGVWWAAVYGVAQSRTRLKWLSSSNSSNLWCVKTVI